MSSPPRTRRDPWALRSLVAPQQLSRPPSQEASLPQLTGRKGKAHPDPKSLVPGCPVRTPILPRAFVFLLAPPCGALSWGQTPLRTDMSM